VARDKYLPIYLNDHFAGATAGVELARRSASNNEGNEFGALMSRLADEIDSDRAALEEIMDDLGVTKDPLKIGVAWIAERAGRLKLNGHVLKYSDLSRLLEFEGLAIGIHAKGALWRSLRDVAAVEPRLDAAKLDDLIARADRQRDEIESYRLRASAIAFDGANVS